MQRRDPFSFMSKGRSLTTPARQAVGENSQSEIASVHADQRAREREEPSLLTLLVMKAALLIFFDQLMEHEIGLHRCIFIPA